MKIDEQEQDMNRQAFIWRDVDGITDNYHDSGGVFVVADDLDAARDALKAQCPDVEEVDAPDIVMATDHDPIVVLFPNAGCC